MNGGSTTQTVSSRELDVLHILTDVWTCFDRTLIWLRCSSHAYATIKGHYPMQTIDTCPDFVEKTVAT